MQGESVPHASCPLIYDAVYIAQIDPIDLPQGRVVVC